VYNPAGVSRVYSHSRLGTFEDCPRRFEYRYVLREPEAFESIEAFVGRQVHAVLERLQIFLARGQVPSLRRVLQRFRTNFEADFDPDRIRVIREGTPLEHYLSYGERCLENYYRSHYPFDADETISVEERVVFSLDPEGRYRMQGFIDRLARAPDGALEIHDYKTSRRAPRQAQLDRDRQLALYQIGVRARYPEAREIRLVWHYLGPGRTFTSSRSEEALEELRARTLELVREIEQTRRFEPRPGPLCAWCGYRDRCPASPHREE